VHRNATVLLIKMYSRVLRLVENSCTVHFLLLMIIELFHQFL